MAILVSNPSTVQFTGAPAEPQDPSVIPQDAGFTEELANAMQPSPQLAEGAYPAADFPGMAGAVLSLGVCKHFVNVRVVGDHWCAVGID